ncbi:MAG TPA: SprT-like domain-containing protein [Chitinophagaceae bacterium]|nr:SprT-like domain-containing protein [Chitinophagaceae bacterium]
MPKQEYPLTHLQNYLPVGAAALVLDLLQHYKVHLTITRERKTVLGDYRHAHNNAAHRISVNGNLNKYAFLITLIHELAHLVTFLEYGNRVNAHGREWKLVYKMLLLQFLELAIFPQDVLVALQSSLHNLPASSCADEGLMRILRRYDKKIEGMLLVEELPDGALFALDDGKIFKKGKRLRKRFQCTEVKTGKLYLFSPVYEVKKVS